MARRSRKIKVEEVEQVAVAPINDFKIAVDHFLESLKTRGLRPMTVRWHRANLNDVYKALRDQEINVDPTQITKDQIVRHYIKHGLETRKLTPITMNGRIASLKQFYAWLYDEEHVSRNIMAEISKMRVDEKEPKSLTRQQVKRLLKTADTSTFVGLRDRAIMMLLLDTGIRLKELIDLKLDDLDLIDCRLTIREAKNRSGRVVPFQRKATAMLKQWLKVRGKILGEDSVFVTVDNTPLTRKAMQDRLKVYGAMAGITNVSVSPHVLRHTFARLYIENGGDPFSLQQILGHSSQDMVAIYVRFWSKELSMQHKKFSPMEHLSEEEAF